MKRNNYITVKEASQQLELAEYRVRQLIREKQIHATKIKQWRIKPKDLEEFVRARTNRKS